MNIRPLHIDIMPLRLAVSRFDAAAPVPDWADNPDFCVIARTAGELSIVAPESSTPPDARQERGFRALALRGPFAFSEVGIIASVIVPLAEAKISVVPIATFDTDYVLVRESAVEAAISALRAAGHTVND